MVTDLNLMPGDWVEIRSAAEILASLDRYGCLQGLPFMPEMLPFCGTRHQVFKRADKACDPTGDRWSLRRMTGTVLLAEPRCSGESHGGCETGCLLFWKEVWLKHLPAGDAAPHAPAGENRNVATRGRVTAVDDVKPPAENGLAFPGAAAGSSGPIVNLQQLERATLQCGSVGSPDACYRCQATELRHATSRLPWWEPRQYLRDMYANGVSLFDVVRGLTICVVNALLRRLKRPTYPNVQGALTRTPADPLGLQPGELVEVKSKAEIVATLDRNGKNRGMTFDVEMIPYCGRRLRVLRRVERIVDEKTGRLLQLPNPSIILDGAICTGCYHRFCPRGTYPFWREIWLRRVEQPAGSVSVSSDHPTAHTIPSGEGAVAN